MVANGWGVRGETKGLGGPSDQAGHTGPLEGLASGDQGAGQSSNSAPRGTLRGSAPAPALAKHQKACAGSERTGRARSAPL